MQRSEFEHKPSARDQRIAELSGIALRQGFLRSDRYAMRVSTTTAEVWVTKSDPTGPELVAYSSMEADRIPSIEEFVADFFT